MIRSGGRGEIERGEVAGRERGDRRQRRQHRFEGEHRLDAFAGRDRIGPSAKAHAIAEETTEGTARIDNRRFLRILAIEPSALDAGDPAAGVGDGGKQRRPGFARCSLGLAVPDARMKAESHPIETPGDAAGVQIGLGLGATNRPPGAEQAARGLGRVARRRRCPWAPLGGRQGEKSARLVDRLGQAGEAAIETDQVEEIAMLAACGIAEFAGRTRTVIGAGEPHIEAAARGVADVAGEPVAARPAPVREVMTAHRLGVAREAARQLGSARHRTCPDQAAARLLVRRIGCRSRSAAKIAGPQSGAVGTKSRSRQAMISETRPSAFNWPTMPPVKSVNSIR